MTHNVTDAPILVIGSGFGGAVAACRLAQAGFPVRVIERGRRYLAGDFPNLPEGDAFLPDTRRWSFAMDEGLFDIVDLEEIVSVQAAGYGGGSLIYANVHLRPPAVVFGDRWPKMFQGRKALDPYFDLAASMLQVAPISTSPNRHQVGKGEQLKAAAATLKRKVFLPPLTIRHEEDGENDHKVFQRSCTGCGACCTGCPQRSKNTLDLNYLAVAEAHGAEVQTQCEVTELRELANGEWAVRCFDHLEARSVTFHAKHVFLCAGSIHTTRLLTTAKLRKRPVSHHYSPLKKRVGTGYFPGGDSLGFVYDTENPQEPSVGPVISTTLVEWSREDPSSFFMLQDGGYAPEFDRIVGLLQAALWFDRNKACAGGAAKVPPHDVPVRPPYGAPVVPRVPSRFTSFLDQIICGVQNGDFDDVVPAGLKGSKAALAKCGSAALVLAAVVSETITTSTEKHFDAGPLAFLGKWGRDIAVKLAHFAAQIGMGPDEAVGEAAFAAVLDRGNLSVERLAEQIIGISAENRANRAVLLGMGRDAAAGHLSYDRRTRRMVADLDLVKLTPGYTKQELLMRQIARALGGELRTNPAWELLRKPVTVHNQGGCGMSDDPCRGVTDPYGKVQQCEGLYILDGSMLCESVGVNPSATIAALSEHGILQFIRTAKQNPKWPENDPSPGARAYVEDLERAAAWKSRAVAGGWDLSPPHIPPPPPPDPEKDPQPIGIRFTEKMNGYYSPGARDPGYHDSVYLKRENRGRPDFPIELVLNMKMPDLALFMDDPEHRVHATGKVTIRLPGDSVAREFCIPDGQATLLVPIVKDYAIHWTDTARSDAAFEAVGRSPFDSNGKRRPIASMRPWSARPGDPAWQERFMKYVLPFTDEQDGKRWRVSGYKRIARAATSVAWRHTAILHTLLQEERDAPPPGTPCPHGWDSVDEADPSSPIVRTAGAGVVHVELPSFLFEQLRELEVTGTKDPVRTAWAVGEFGAFFFGTLQRIYLSSFRDTAHRSDARRRHANRPS